MTVALSTNKIVYVGNGITTQWDIPFAFLSKEDIEVYRIDPDKQVILLHSEYSINEHTHVLTYPLAQNGIEPLDSNSKLLILRHTSLTQESQFTAQSVLDPSLLEKGYDKAMMVCQDLAEKMDRCIQFPTGYDGENKDIGSYLHQIDTIVSQADHLLTQTTTLKQEIDDIQDTADLAQAWASKTDGVVKGDNYSAKKYAQDAATAADTATQALNTINTTLTNCADKELSNLTANGKIKVASLAMPSDACLDLTIGASGTSYTAPANGYVNFTCMSGTMLQLYNSTKNRLFSAIGVSDNAALGVWLSVEKGDTFQIYYTYVTEWFLRFHYAEGSKSEAN